MGVRDPPAIYLIVKLPDNASCFILCKADATMELGTVDCLVMHLVKMNVKLTQHKGSSDWVGIVVSLDFLIVTAIFS